MTIDDAKAEEIRRIVEAGSGDRSYWQSCTPHERLYALELMRRKEWGYDENLRLDRGYFEVIDVTKYQKAKRAKPQTTQRTPSD